MADPAYVEALIAEGERQNATSVAAAKARTGELDRMVGGVAAVVGALNPAAGLVVAAAWSTFKAVGGWLSGPDPNSDAEKKRAIAALKRWMPYGRPPFAFQGDVWNWNNYGDYLEAGADQFDRLPEAEAAACGKLGEALALKSGDPAVVAALASRRLYVEQDLRWTPAPIGPDGKIIESEYVRKDDGSRSFVQYIGPVEPLLAGALAAAGAGVPALPVQRAAVGAWLAWEEAAARGPLNLGAPVDWSVPARRWGAIALAAVAAADATKPRRIAGRLNLGRYLASSSADAGGAPPVLSPQLALRAEQSAAQSTAQSTAAEAGAGLSTGAKVAIGVGGVGVLALLGLAARRLRWF